MNIPKITLHVFVCDSENYMDKTIWELEFLRKSPLSYMKSCFRNSFRNNFWNTLV